MPRLIVVIASTRPGRVGPAVGKWFFDFAKNHAKFEIELVDLAEVNLPLIDEPAHPRLQQYEHDHTKQWSATVAAGDAFVFVTPEYNFGPPPSLINALDYLFNEWACKPVGFVSYGGVSGGLRSVQMTKLTVTALKMMPLPEAVVIPFFSKLVNDEQLFVPTELIEKSATVMLDELLRWAEALKVLR
ncbi:NADPH-dependent FMN reductase [Fimbriimonas ginsengisoli]|uniref:NADPH-dependent FMN reductase n=1 Tax=Fimbriimonas ginsengisoli Gsoil 348 TaxID=661478 RepID=A0A068NK20_FIMGI|nr:NAD(P)H-dependent oxidoreductase [Fimbriimonas ginsengisoli]AIE83938.1 NADPH-dependent FMN reductase [Fimbriimonas ginsengisoli Gsoil 348]